MRCFSHVWKFLGGPLCTVLSRTLCLSYRHLCAASWVQEQCVWSAQPQRQDGGSRDDVIGKSLQGTETGICVHLVQRRQGYMRRKCSGGPSWKGRKAGGSQWSYPGSHRRRNTFIQVRKISVLSMLLGSAEGTQEAFHLLLKSSACSQPCRNWPTRLSKPARVQETKCMVYFLPLSDRMPVTKSTKDSML